MNKMIWINNQKEGRTGGYKEGSGKDGEEDGKDHRGFGIVLISL